VITSLTWIGDDALPSAIAVGEILEPPEKGWMWVDVSGESEATIRAVCRSFGIPDQLIGDALAEASLPMLEEQRDLVYVVLNSLQTGPGGRLGPSEVDLFVGADFVVSVHDPDLPATDLAIERLRQGIGLSIPSPSGLLSHIAMIGSRRFPALIEHLEDQVDLLEEQAMSADPRALNEVYVLRRDVVVLRRVLAPQREIFDELAESGHHPLIDERSRREFERVAAYQTQVLESLEAARSLLGSVLETYRGAVADQTNEIVRILTVFSAILLPLSLIAGIYGMNFVDIPLAEEPLAFWLTVGVMAVLAVALWLYFGRRGFVGAPRLRELPRAVGLGIHHLGAAPIRAMTDGIESTRRRVTGNADDGSDG
jgi:magnesium transporter